VDGNKKEIIMSKTKQWLMETYGEDLSSMPTEHEQQEAYEYNQAVSALPTIVESKELFKRAVKEQVLSGFKNPLDFYRQAKIIIDCMEELKKDSEIFDCAYTEREKYGKEKPVINGSVIDTGSKTNYDYKACNDPVWNALKEAISDREKFLKSLKEPTTIVDTKTGEAVTINPPETKVSNFFTVKI
jgi:hypothetical protein